MAGMQLFDINEDVIYWLRARRQLALGYIEGRRTDAQTESKSRAGRHPAHGGLFLR